MKSEVQRRFVLELTEREATILKSMLQNPPKEDEPAEVTKVREAIFSALLTAGR